MIAATDFLPTEVWALSGLKTFYVLFMIELNTRRVHLGGSTQHPHDLLTGHGAVRASKFLSGRRFLICDGDTNFKYRLCACAIHARGVLRIYGDRKSYGLTNGG